MSNLRKWMNLMESVPAQLADQPPRRVMFKKDATVMVDPRVGGGTGRFMEYTPNGAMVDIKGIAMELAHGDFSAPERDYDEPLAKGNDWFHMSLQPDTVGSMKDKPEFRPGDMVKIADVYGTVIGPGYGIFIAYSTSGNECIISFDDKEIVVPTSSVGAVLEQNAKDSFAQTDNDGALSPMSLGSENVKIENPAPQVNININGTETMDRKDEFSQWMNAIEEALAGENGVVAEAMPVNAAECGCGAWDCMTCFPDHEGEVMMPGMNVPPQTMAAQATDACAMCSHPVHGDDMHAHDEMEVVMPVEEEDMDFSVAGHEKPASGKGVKLGDIVQKYVPADQAGEESPLTHGEDNLAEEIPADDWEPDYSELIGKIMYMQDMGLSKSSTQYTPYQLQLMSPEQQKQVYQEVMGEVAETDMPMMSAEEGMAQSPTGLAPTMPEGTIMENVDKDIAAMLDSLKRLDKLTESVAPVLARKKVLENSDREWAQLLQILKGMPEARSADIDTLGEIASNVAVKISPMFRITDDLLDDIYSELHHSPQGDLFEKKAKPDFLDVDKDGDKKESMKKAIGDKKNGESDSEGGELDEDSHLKNGKKSKWSDDPKDHFKEEKVEEGADPEVVAWMARFSKLGRM